MNTQEFIEVLTAALSFKFPNDAMMPGVVISCLRNKQFYVSLVRYCPKKKVILKSTRMSLADALDDVGRMLLTYEVKKAEKDPMDYLEEAVSYFNPKPEDGESWVDPDPYGDDNYVKVICDDDIPF